MISGSQPVKKSMRTAAVQLGNVPKSVLYGTSEKIAKKRSKKWCVDF